MIQTILAERKIYVQDSKLGIVGHVIGVTVMIVTFGVAMTFRSEPLAGVHELSMSSKSRFDVKSVVTPRLQDRVEEIAAHADAIDEIFASN